MAAFGQDALTVPKVSLEIGKSGSEGEVSSSLQILALLTVLSLAPALMILTTAFTRIVIIFSFLRNAMGTPTIPPNQVVIGLSLFLTFFVMAPTYETINETALQPYMKKQISFDQAVTNAQKPVREFMLKNTYSKDLRMFLDIRQENATAEDVSLVSLIPAFVISELKTAFIIGFYIFVPFLIIDLVVASGLMSMGMMMLPPTVVSLPAKLLIFVLADGWSMLVNAILQGYR
ncbi:MAG: flagellar type III secretion system pore protein FliP [Fimbriimonadaceae bacterium]|nr:flagellar type III secretion system pore protein FliP [Fimbriimonadaceae bacterium]